jgi:microcystin-dependent protein
MAILSRGQTFASGDQVTAQKLQDIVDLANFDEPADGATIIANNTNYGVPGGDGKLKVPSNGIGSNELASDASVDANRAVGTNHIKDGSVTADKLDSAAVSVLMPTASLMPYAGSSAPTGYLLCDGAAISRTTYSSLFGIVGTTYGVGDGSTTFNIPDLRGRVIAGLDINTGGFADRLTTGSAANINGRALGSNNGNPGDTGRGTNGAQEHLLTSAESGLPAHNHVVGTMKDAGEESTHFGGTDDTGSVTTRTTANNTAQNASSAHNNVQPTIILNYIIKT